jgi:PAS domain S-box-containing protein
MSSSALRQDGSHRDAVNDAEQLAEEARRTHLRFLESMDRVNRAIQGTNDLEQMMSDVLDAVLDIFDCDRAVLGYPCDPETTWFRVPMRRGRPAFPSAFIVGEAYHADDEVRAVFRSVKAAGGPVALGAGSEHDVPALICNEFGVRSALAMAVHPKVDRPYQFTIHQCSHPRVWTAEEQRLFQEIGRRLGDGLTTMLMLRNLRQSESRLEEAQRITHVSYFERDLDTGSYTVSDEGYRMLGLEPTGRQLTLADVLLRVHPDDREKVARVDGTLREGGCYEIECRVIWPSGEVRILHSWGDVVPEASGPPRRAVGIVQDVTDRKREEYLTSRVFDSSPDGIAIIGRDYRYRRVNHVYARAWHLPADRMIGMHVADAIGAAIFERASKANIDRCLAGEHVEYASWFDTPFGRVYDVVRYTPLLPDSERVDSVLVVLSDLTEHMRAQEALQKAQADLAHMARVTTLAELGSSIAHEVSQPLAAIRVGGDACQLWLAADPPNVDEARQAIQRIIDDGNRATEVIARIRALLRRGEPTKEPLSVDELIHETVALTRTELTRHGVDVETDLRATLAVVGDRVQLQQVLVNLFLNGADAMSAVTDRPRRLAVRSRDDGETHVVVDIADTGVGFASGDVDRIFAAFFSTKADGLGMGLSISRSIVEAHGGRLWATPNDGSFGATLHFTLPAATEASP